MFSSITIRDSKKGISSFELYSQLEISKQYSSWIKYTLTENPMFEEKTDYHTLGYDNHKGRGKPKLEYWIKLDVAKEICMISRSSKASEIRKSIIRLLDEHSDGKWITIAQGKIVHEFITQFKYIENQSKVEKIALEYLRDGYRDKSVSYQYGKAQKQRNQALDYSSEEVKREYQAWCILNKQKHLKYLNKKQMTYYFNKYLLIRNAVWDFLTINNYTENIIEIASFVANVAEQWEIEIYPKNEDNLFQEKEKLNSLQYSEVEIKKLTT